MHKGQRYPGAHPAIVEPAVFEAVQRALAERTAASGERGRRSSGAPLQGKLYDQAGAIMSPSAAQGRSGKRYRYYVSAPAPAQPGHDPAGTSIRRISAPALEALVLRRCSAWLDRDLDWAALLPGLVRIDLAQESIAVALDRSVLFEGDPDPEHALALLGARLVAGERLRPDPSDPSIVRIRMAVRPQLRGGRTFIAGGAAQVGAPPRPDPIMIKGLRASHALLERMAAQPWKSAAELAEACAPADSYERRLLCVALLAPDIQAAILDGRQPADLKLADLTRRDLPLAWVDQRALLGIAPS